MMAIEFYQFFIEYYGRTDETFVIQKFEYILKSEWLLLLFSKTWNNHIRCRLQWGPHRIITKWVWGVWCSVCIIWNFIECDPMFLLHFISLITKRPTVSLTNRENVCVCVLSFQTRYAHRCTIPYGFYVSSSMFNSIFSQPIVLVFCLSQLALFLFEIEMFRRNSSAMNWELFF